MKMLRKGCAAALLSAAISAVPLPALACSSCGCTLSSDWSSQGIAPSGEGFRVDFRFDYFDQDQLRSGTGSVDRGSLAIPNEQEIQQQTINRNYALGIDYSPNEDWGVNLQLPYFDRYHTTIAPGDTEISTSHTQEHRRRAAGRPVPRLHGGPQHRRAARRQARDRKLRQQLHLRAAGGRAARSRAAAGHGNDGPARRRLHVRRVRPRLGLFRCRACCSSRSIRATAFARAPGSISTRAFATWRTSTRAVAADQRAHRRPRGRARTPTSTTAARRSCT